MQLIPHPNQRFTKIDENGNALPNEATNHVAVLDTLPRADGLWRVWAAANLTSRGRPWDEASAAAKNLNLLGTTEWDLPTIEEQLSIVDYTRHDPAIDDTFFPGTVSDWYWTKTDHAKYASFAWIVSFGSGSASDRHRGNYAFARAVRRVSPSQ